MALVNPNIALAGTPMQVPNFLGMQQTAATTQNTLARTGIMQEEAGRASESAKYNTALSRSKDALRFVNSPEDYLAWTQSSFSDPELGSILQSMGLTPEKALASAREQLRQPGGLQSAIGRSASSIDQLAQSMTQQGGQARAQAQAQAEAARARQAQEAQAAQVSAVMGAGAPSIAPVATATPVAPPIDTMQYAPGTSGAINQLYSGVDQVQTPALNALVQPPAGQPPVAQPPVGPAPVGQPPAAGADPRMAQLLQLDSLAVAGNSLAAEQAKTLRAQIKFEQDQAKFLREQQPKPEQLPAALQEYKFAVDQGFPGTFEDWRGTKPPLFESEYEKLVGKTAAERDTSAFDSAATAADNLPKMFDTLNQIEASDAITGIGADVLKNVERLRSQFTSDKKAGKRVADTEVLNALLGSEVFPLIGALGIGARGLDTPAEREFLREVMTGTIQMDKAALSRLTRVRINIAERAIDKYNERVEKGELDRFFRTQGLEPQKIEKPVFESRAVAKSLSEEERQALEWSNSNPNDPRSAEIKRRLGM